MTTPAESLPQVMFDCTATTGPLVSPFRDDFSVYATDGTILARMPLKALDPVLAASLPRFTAVKGPDFHRVTGKFGYFLPTPVTLPGKAERRPPCRACDGLGQRLIAGLGAEPGPCRDCDGTGKAPRSGAFVPLTGELGLDAWHAGMLAHNGAEVFPPAPDGSWRHAARPYFRFTCGKVTGWVEADTAESFADRDRPRVPRVGPGQDRTVLRNVPPGVLNRLRRLAR